MCAVVVMRVIVPVIMLVIVLVIMAVTVRVRAIMRVRIIAMRMIVMRVILRDRRYGPRRHIFESRLRSRSASAGRAH
jgi:hypothetical protein